MKSNFDTEKVAIAIEADAGETLPDLRQALAEANAGTVGRTTGPEQPRVGAAYPRHPGNKSTSATGYDGIP